MTTPSLLWQVPECEIDQVEQHLDELVIVAHMNSSEASCPTCGCVSTHVHSHYRRHPQDLPIGEGRVRLHLAVRRFRCLNPTCPCRTFAERMPAFLPTHAQRTQRLTRTLHQVALTLGGEAGARLSSPLHMPTSPATLLRIMRQATVTAPSSPRVVGVDDFALRRGRTYGTILVDLEHRCAIDLLPDRTASTLANWLQQHPTITIIARDRSTEYARGATEGAPAAQQVADRWHLLQNVRQMLERMLTRRYADLRQLSALAPLSTDKESTATRTAPFLRAHTDDTASRGSRQQRMQLYAEIQSLRRQGHNMLQIARRLGIARGTTRRYFYAESFPERAQRQVKPSLLDPFLPYLSERYRAGCINASQLWREIQAQGYQGTPRQVMRWLQPQRQVPAPTTPTRYIATLRTQQGQPTEAGNNTASLPSAKQLAWLMNQTAEQLTADEASTVAHICQHDDVNVVYPLIQQFITMIRHTLASNLDPWLQACAATGVACLQTFATGIQHDYAAVRAALESPWSNGQTEGQVNRLKLIKRQMYGRASFDLLRLRVLAA